MKAPFCYLLLSFALVTFVGCQPSGSTPKAKSVQSHATTNTVTMTPSPTAETTNPITPSQEDDMPKDPPLSIPRNPGLETLIEKAKADLAQRLSISVSQIKVIEAKEAAWPDASLGCSQPGTRYSKIPTPGYIIMLAHAGDEFEYHASIRGDIFTCENPAPPLSGTPEDIPFYIPTP